MWYCQWRDRSGLAQWFTLHMSKHQGTVELLMDKMKRKFPSFQWQIVYRDN